MEEEFGVFSSDSDGEKWANDFDPDELDQSLIDEEYDAMEAKHGAMFRLDYLDDFLYEDSDEETLDETTKRFLKQVRATSGYGVDCKPALCFYDSPFSPYEPGKHPDYANGLADEAMKLINEEVKDKGGYFYEFVRIERFVRTRGLCKLLTLSVKDSRDRSIKTLRACIVVPYEPNFRYSIEEWKLVPSLY